jgi:phage gp36-like protein
MKKLLFTMLLILASFFTVFAEGGSDDGVLGRCQAPAIGRSQTPSKEEVMAYCSIEDLHALYGENRISAWSRKDGKVTERAINNASAEIDGYLISGGYVVPIAGPPENLKNYCIDIASANLIISAGVLQNDPGGEAIVKKADVARQFLSRVAEGKYKIPDYVKEDEVSHPPGGVKVASSERLDLRGF